MGRRGSDRGTVLVLFRIEHFHQRRRRIAPEIAPSLSHFIQHENRIVGFGRGEFPERFDLAMRRCKCAGVRVFPPHRYMPPIGMRTGVPAPGQSIFPQAKFARSQCQRSTGSAPVSAAKVSSPPGNRECAPFTFSRSWSSWSRMARPLGGWVSPTPGELRPGQRNHPLQTGSRDHCTRRELESTFTQTRWTSRSHIPRVHRGHAGFFGFFAQLVDLGLAVRQFGPAPCGCAKGCSRSRYSRWLWLTCSCTRPHRFLLRSSANFSSLESSRIRVSRRRRTSRSSLQKFLPQQGWQRRQEVGGDENPPGVRGLRC